MTDDAETPAFPGSGFFEHISEQDVQRLLGAGWSREDVRLQAAWQLALHGHQPTFISETIGVPVAFAELLVQRAEDSGPSVAVDE